MASPNCLVNNGSTLNGVDVTASSTVTIKLANTAGVNQWSISCVGTDELLSATTITSGLTINQIMRQATFTAPEAGSALIFQSKVNNGLDINGNVDPTLTTTFGVYVLTSSGYRVGALGETSEGSAAFAWTPKINAMLRGAAVIINSSSAGAGLYFSGGYHVGANPDGSIVVNADDIRVGVLATDAQHGNRGNGSLHAVATGSANGFMPSTHWTLVNGATDAATNGTLVKRHATTGTVSISTLLTNNTETNIFLVNTTATFDGTLQANGAATFDAAVAANAGLTTTTIGASGNATVGGTLGVTGAVSCSSTLGVTGNATFSASISVTVGVFTTYLEADTALFNSSVTFEGPTQYNATVAIDANVQLGGASFGGGVGVVAIGNATTPPGSNPTGGGVLYVQAGALKFRGSSGTVTTIANA